MFWLCGLALLAGAYPLCRALRASRQTTLRQAVLWGACAWAAWLAVPAAAALGRVAEGEFGRHLALCLTGCAGVAVLGARRPGVGAWNWVVCGLLAVLLLPAAEGLGRPRPEPAHLIFLGATLAVGLVNYLPTRLGPAALLLAAGCGAELAFEAAPRLRERAGDWAEATALLCVAAC